MSVSQKALWAGLAVVTTISVAGCAMQPPVTAYSPPGFFSGLLHGLLSPLSLLAGIFLDARIYAFPNSGWFYDFGFMLGLLPWAGGASGAAR